MQAYSSEGSNYELRTVPTTKQVQLFKRKTERYFLQT